ncbi:phosphotyrosine protein, partial [Punctularia strigosozonata HHB-11173 SS5]|uniref:phosphotyrosine protein n=1 Tax=Punctularia strigosozonata (strain HHB-11173) TaxID=741275 RepID=UPI0004416A88
PSQPLLHVPRPPIGNLLLSSCPGKKRQGQGQGQGQRPAVRRSVRADLARIRALGVGCVVCLLDDAELAFLGAPWEEYAQAAREVGVDVVRVPTPEGLGPLALGSSAGEGGEEPTVAGLDACLDAIIARYTRRSVPVLVHCRGGVGRAGVLAACWAIKLGLLGWLDPPTPCPTSPPRNKRKHSATFAFAFPEKPEDEKPRKRREEEESGVRIDTLRLVERAIALVRRRRSVKAVETYEQVRFLVEYVEYLRTKA